MLSSLGNKSNLPIFPTFWSNLLPIKPNFTTVRVSVKLGCGLNEALLLLLEVMLLVFRFPEI